MSDSLVIYFSATGTTKKVAQYIKEVSKSDIIEIIPEEKYTDEDLNYNNNNNSRVNNEHKNESSRPKIANKINIEKYNTVYLGYPIWWGDVPKIILTLLDTYDFTGKKIILFCTSGGSDISQSAETIKSYGIEIKANRKFNSSSTMNEIKSWISQIK